VSSPKTQQQQANELQRPNLPFFWHSAHPRV
jgi:hypothetical protein